MSKEYRDGDIEKLHGACPEMAYPDHVEDERRIAQLEDEVATLRAFVAAYDKDQAVNVVNGERILASTFETRNAVREARGRIK